MRSPAWNGSPAFGMADRRRSGSAARICATNSRMRAGPSEQLTPATSTPAWASRWATSAGPAPSMVSPSLPKVISATTGRSVSARAVSTASASSARSEKVSKMSRSAPASQSTSICSRKASVAAVGCNTPLRRTRLPSGPTEPAIHAAAPLISRASRASFTPRKLMSRILSSRLHSLSLMRLAAKVFVWMTSAPALM